MDKDVVNTIIGKLEVAGQFALQHGVAAQHINAVIAIACCGFFALLSLATISLAFRIRNNGVDEIPGNTRVVLWVVSGIVLFFVTIWAFSSIGDVVEPAGNLILSKLKS